jgi:putative transposase
MVAAAIRTIFAQPTGAEVIDQLDKVAAMLGPKFPAVARMLADARQDLTAFASFPPAHWVKIWSTNPLERVNKRSSAGRMSWASFPTTRRCCGWPARS